MKRTEEQQKDYIFDIFSKCHSETAPTRLLVYYPTLCEQVYLWYRDYLSIDVDKMGLEITKVINSFIGDKNIPKIPKDKDGFFKYLAASIYTEKAVTYREYNENDKIKIPREKKRKLRDVEDSIRMKESQLGRTLSNDERMRCISKWFKKQEYIDLYNAKNVGRMYINNNENNETDALDLPDTQSGNPLDEYINKNNMETFLEAVTSVLAKKQERARDCYKALFTLHCIEKYKDFEGLNPVLDSQVIETWQKDGKEPNQYEIYQKYHPKVNQKSAEAMASKNLKEFLTEIEKYLKEKNK